MIVFGVFLLAPVTFKHKNSSGFPLRGRSSGLPLRSHSSGFPLVLNLHGASARVQFLRLREERLRPYCGHLGVILGPAWASRASWAHLGPSWHQLGKLCAILGPFLDHLGHIRRHLGASWGLLGPSWSRCLTSLQDTASAYFSRACKGELPPIFQMSVSGSYRRCLTLTSL